MRQLNIGCGPYKTKGWINIDANPNYSPEILRDVARGLPFDDSSVDEVLTSHFLEHLRHEDLIFLIGEIYRVLKHGGIWRIVAPLENYGMLDHRVLFTEFSFDCLLRPENEAYFQIKMKWEEVARNVRPEPPHKNLNALYLTLKAIK